MSIKWSLGIRLTTVEVARYWGSIEMCIYVLLVVFFGVEYFMMLDAYPKVFSFAQKHYDLSREAYCLWMMSGCGVLAVASFLMTLGAIERWPPLIFAWFLTTPCVVVYSLKLIILLHAELFLPLPCFQCVVLVSVAVFVFRIYQVSIQDNRAKKTSIVTTEINEFETILLDEQMS